MNSLGRRFSLKLLSNSTSFLISVLITFIVPRVLGPSNYGNFNFISSEHIDSTNCVEPQT